jgi:flagellar biosynthetic protein FliQ
MPLYLHLLLAALHTETAALTPIIVVLLAVGLGTAVVQAALQIEDATFSLLPKTLAMIVIALSGGFGALTLFEALARTFILQAPALVHQSWN